MSRTTFEVANLPRDLINCPALQLQQSAFLRSEEEVFAWIVSRLRGKLASDMNAQKRASSLALFALCSMAGCGENDKHDSPTVFFDAASEAPQPDAGIEAGRGGAPTMGPSDETARKACAALAAASTFPVVNVKAVGTASEAEAAQAKIAVDGSRVFSLELTKDREGWVNLDEDHWDATIAFFALGEAPYEVRNAEMQPQSDGPLLNGLCPGAGITDYRVAFHHWSPAALRFSPGLGKQVKIFVVKVESE